MPSSERIPQETLKSQEKLHGFVVERVTSLPDIRSVAYELSHEKSGARAVHLHTKDSENLMAIAFRTPPPDDTGLPHILEHTVLCGSSRYPVKDPFVELLKTSLATFLNAMTYPDKTVYPCASMVEKDFFNIADVYCDAVFNPLISEEHFKQEGHHLAFAKPGNLDSALVIKGIVYNEMKGAYSDLDGTIERYLSRSICPDNAYGRDSGGDPDEMPRLTYDEFRRFHATYYHPSNALILLYGDIPTERHLAFLDAEYLSGFERIHIDTAIAAQPRWREPRRETVPYPIGAHEDPSGKTAVVMSFLTNDITEAIRALSMTLLDYYLLGNAASPLRKALIDSKLGQELTDSGYASYQRDTYFTVGLKGTDPEKTDAIIELVRSTCQRLVREGLEKDKVESAFHRLELASREIQGHYPLHLMDRVYRSWLYDADPLYNLRLNEHLAELRKLYGANDGFLERQLEEMILHNPHYTVLTFVPDTEYTAKKEQAFHEKMATQKSAMSREDLARVAREAEELQAKQSSPNPPEALAKLPRLCLSDVPKDTQELDTTIEDVAGMPVLYTDMFSNGLNYAHLAFDLRGIDDDLIDYLPLYTEALRKMGAGDFDYVAMAEREAAATGGVGAGISVGGVVNDPFRIQPFLMVSSKAIDSKLPEMLQILSDRLTQCDPTDMARLKDVILQGRVGRRSQIVPNGWHYAIAQAERHLSRNGALSERVGGVTQVRLFDRLASQFDELGEDIANKILRIRDFVLAKGRVTASYVGEQKLFVQFRDFLSTLASGFREERPPEEPADFEPVLHTREAIATPADVAFVAKAFRSVGATHEHAPALLLLSVNLSYGYLWEEVRVKRGAYGARAIYNPLGGTFSFASYRDPFVLETLDAYDRVFGYIQERMDLSAKAVEQAIIGTVKTLDRPIRPGQAVGTAIARYLNGETYAFRRSFRQRLLGLSGEDIRKAARETLDPAYGGAPVCVLSSREKLEEVNKTLGESALDITDL